MNNRNLSILLSLFLLVIVTIQAKGRKTFRYDEDAITKRKSLDEAYARFGKTYKPYDASHSNLGHEVAKQLETLFNLTDMAVIEKVLLLEFIGKIHEGDLPRDTPYKNYYQEILDKIENLKTKDKRIEKIKYDLIKGIEHHRNVLKAWLDAARDDEVKRVQNKVGRWVHPGTGIGDKIFRSLYYDYIIQNFKDEYPENLQALSRHLCVLVF